VYTGRETGRDFTLLKSARKLLSDKRGIESKNWKGLVEMEALREAIGFGD
jgi:hypothetical protein